MTIPGVQEAYDESAEAWLGGPDAVYGPLAGALIAAAPMSLDGVRVLDLGAGTGTASRAALAAGARMVVALDLAAGMLRMVDPGVRPVLGDICRMPFRDGSFDLAVAAFCLGHVPEPIDCLREGRRVSSVLLAGAFQLGWTHPAKAAVDEVLQGRGYVAPDWYLRFKHQFEPRVEDADWLAAAALSAGYRCVDVSVVEVRILCGVAGLVRWRLGMAHLAPFVGTLSPGDRAGVQAAAEAALEGAPPLVIPMVVLAAR